MNNQLIVFLRKPVRGEVKTRLASGIGQDQALSVYKWLISITLDAAKKVNAEIHLFLDRTDKEFNVPDSFSIHVQDGSDLGERMMNSFKSLSGNGEKNTIIIGSDCPEMHEDILDEAYMKLSEKDLVVGPAVDGGFYLLGMKKAHTGLFDGIVWGGENVFDRLVSNARLLNLSFTVLGHKRDIDEASDFTLFKDQYEQYCLKEYNNVTQG